MINRILFPWIRKRQGRVITMPANSGKQENLILDAIQESGSKSKLFTCDREFKKNETNISEQYSGWEEHHVGDIFEWLLSNDMLPAPTAVWFDMCGPLTLANLDGIVGSTIKLCASSSLLFVTLCVHGARGLINDSITKKIYSHTLCPQMRAELTEEILKVHISPYKKIKALREPYVYRRNAATFAVFFLSIK